MSYTLEQIYAVADAIAERGENPTINKVRQELGGGSYTTISDAMRHWRTKQKEEQALAETKLPESLQDRLHKTGAELWQTAVNEAERRLAERHKEFEAQKEDLNSQLADAHEAIQSLEQEYAQAKTRIEELEEKLLERDRETEQLNLQLQQCQQERAEAQTLQKASEQEIAYLRDDLNNAKQTIARYEDRFENLLQRFEQGDS
ncbi:DNA-binding protein [Halorhodospira halochloris]|uniref:DNA-binding protein n=1 Tax=Halorhodospira halochloris TaxID=1052 RepID=UPI001EE7C728|nr:DNA-binding protein [Halorhodospira halochloris]MCG5531328.1 DNA-binding protein [Halorhodospira halochloris]